MEFLAPTIGFLVFLSVGAALGIASSCQIGRLRRRLTSVESTTLDLARQVAALGDGDARPTSREPHPRETEPTVPTGEQPEAPAAPEPETPPSPDASRQDAAQGAFARIEAPLTSRWLVWIGALALSLGGAFLVQYSIDRAWLVPELRCGLGALLGLTLVGYCVGQLCSIYIGSPFVVSAAALGG